VTNEIDLLLKGIGERDTGKDRSREEIFGQIAVRLGHVSETQMEECRVLQQKLDSMGLWEKLGSIMIKKGYLTRDKVEEVLNQQGAGRVFGEFEILAKLGEGGMGSVYKAIYKKTSDVVALKILPEKLANNPKLLHRFVNEIKMAMMLDHPNLVSGVDMGEVEGYNYLAMKYIDGKSVQALIDERSVLTERVTLSIAIQVARALEYASENEVLHRDIKPDNILISPRDENDRLGTPDNRAYLIDLGIAKFLLEDTSLTLHGRVVGTPHYMSPEQAIGLPDLDFRSDLYSLGATMYYMLSGRVPFEGSSALTIMNKVKNERPINLSRLRPDLIPATTRIVSRLMAKKPENRYQSHEKLIADIQRVLDGKESRVSIKRLARIEIAEKTPSDESDRSKALADKQKPQNTYLLLAIGFILGICLGLGLGLLLSGYI